MPNASIMSFVQDGQRNLCHLRKEKQLEVWNMMFYQSQDDTTRLIIFVKVIRIC